MSEAASVPVPLVSVGVVNRTITELVGAIRGIRLKYLIFYVCQSWRWVVISILSYLIFYRQAD